MTVSIWRLQRPGPYYLNKGDSLCTCVRVFKITVKVTNISRYLIWLGFFFFFFIFNAVWIGLIVYKKKNMHRIVYTFRKSVLLSYGFIFSSNLGFYLYLIIIILNSFNASILINIGSLIKEFWQEHWHCW